VAQDNDAILDTELEQLISTHITTYETMILVFTECYGGDMVDDFASYLNTTLLSATTPGNLANYGGYHRGLAANLIPGTTTDAAHDAGVAAHVAAGARDTPWNLGPNVLIGGTSSTHVLVWIGRPNGTAQQLDQRDITDIFNNFMGQPSTSVTILAGDGTRPYVDAPATRQELEDALETIGSQMDENEQFILFVGDHGNRDNVVEDITCFTTCSAMLDCSAHGDMVVEADNQPNLSVITIAHTGLSCFESVEFNGNNLTLPTADDVYEQDYDNDGTPDAYKYVMEVSESWIQPEDNQIEFSLAPSCGPVGFERVVLESGAIARMSDEIAIPAVSEWGLISLAVLLCAAAVTVFALRRKTMAA
jgi:hypothetical protein